MFNLVLSTMGRMADAVDIPGFPWKTLVPCVVAFNCVFNTYIDYRQLKVLRRKEIPANIKSLIKDEAQFEKTQAYGQANIKLAVVSRIYDLILTAAIYKFDLIPLAWSAASKATAAIGLARFSGEISQTFMFTLLTTPLQELLSLPMSLYKNFVIEEKFGFNNYTIGLYLKDKLKSTLVSTVLMNVIICPTVKLARYFGDIFFVYVTAFILVLMIVMIVVFPTVIEPMFYTFTPLEDGSLKTKVLALADRFNFPLKQLFVQDSSTRSSHSNAYFTGLPWFKRVVVYDTLIEKNTEEEVVAVLAHELGHWQLNHIPKTLLHQITLCLFNFSLFNMFVRNHSLFASLGFAPGVEPIAIAFFVFSEAMGSVEVPLKMWSAWFTRKNEYEADLFAAQNGYGEDLSSALRRMQETDLATLTADWFYSCYHYSHPILPERLNALELAIRKTK